MSSGSNPLGGARNIKPSNSRRLPFTTRAIYIGAVPDEKKGQILVEMEDRNIVKYNGLSSGDLLSIRAKKIFKTGTTATDIVILHQDLSYGNSTSYNAHIERYQFTYPIYFEYPDSKFRYSTLDSSTCPAIPDSYVLSSHPRTEITRNGLLAYQRHNFLKRAEDTIVLLQPSPYVLVCRGLADHNYGHYQLETLAGEIISTNQMVTNSNGYFGYQFTAEDKIQRITVNWTGSEDRYEDIYLFSGYFGDPTEYGDYHRLRRLSSGPSPRDNVTYITDSGYSSINGYLIESQNSMNLLPRSDPGVKWKSILKSTNYRHSSKDVPVNPAGKAGAYVLYHSLETSDPREGFRIDRIKCPYAVGINGGEHLTFSIFIKPLRYKSFKVRIMERVSVTFDLDSYNVIVTGEEADGISVVNTTILDFTSGFRRISIGMASPISIKNVSIEIMPVRADVIDACATGGPSREEAAYFAVWGAQVENNALPSSYLPTLGTPLQLPGEFLSIKDRFLGDLTEDGMSFILTFDDPPYLKNLKIHSDTIPVPNHLVWWWGSTGAHDFGILVYMEIKRDSKYLCIVHIDDSYYHYGGHTKGNSTPPDFYRMRRLSLDSLWPPYTLVFTIKNRKMIGFINGREGEIFSAEGIDKKYVYPNQADFHGLKSIELWNPVEEKPPDGFFNSKYQFKYSVPVHSYSVNHRHLEIQEVLDVFRIGV